MRLNVGVIGLGRIGKLHAEHLALRIPEANLAVISEIKGQLDAAKNFAERFCVPQVTDDYHEVLENSDIDAVVICTPTDTHSQIIVEAAQAGKHIFCEKPIAHELSRVDEALAAVRQAGVKFQVGFNKRFDPTFVQVKREILEGRVGVPHIMHIVSRDPAPPSLDFIKSSGGIFLDMAIHDFDMARFLTNLEVAEVAAFGGVRIDPRIAQADDIDTALTVLVFTDGTICTIDNSRRAVYGYDQRIEVFGSGGSVATENLTAYRTVISDSEGIHTPKPLDFFTTRYTESYSAEMQAFIEAIINDTPTLVSGDDGRIAIVIALAAKKAYLEKRTVRLIGERGEATEALITSGRKEQQCEQ